MKRKKFSAQLKAKLAPEATGGEEITGRIASRYGVHPQQVSLWKRRLLEKASMIFDPDSDKQRVLEKAIEEPYKEIGQLKVEGDFLSRRLGML